MGSFVDVAHGNVGGASAKADGGAMFNQALEVLVMRNFSNIIVHDFNSFSRELVDYVDAFDPNDSLPLDVVRMAGTEVIPPLLRSLEERDLHAVVGFDLDTVAKLYRASDGRMKRLIPTNDPRYHPNATRSDTMVLALMRGSAPYGCVASRLLWCEGTLAEEMENGRLWVSNPATMWTPADRCIVRAPVAKSIKACYVAFTGSIYLAQEVTGGATLAAMLRLHYLWLVSHWRFSWMIGIIEGALARKHAYDVYGYGSMDMGIWRTRPGEGDELHKYELVSTDRETAMQSWLRPETGELARALGRPPLTVLPVEGNRAEAT
jgi:hypothetical protein